MTTDSGIDAVSDRRNGMSPGGWKRFASVALILAVTTALAFVLGRLLPHANLSLLFLTGVLLVSGRYGIRLGLLASVLSFLLFNFLFTQPFYTFEVHGDGDVATLVFFLIMAAITGNLAARMRREMAERQASIQRISSLFEFGRQMTSAASTQEVLDALVAKLSERLGSPAVAQLRGADGRFEPAAWAGRDRGLLAPDWTVNENGDSESRQERITWPLATTSGEAGRVLLDCPAQSRSALDLDFAGSLCDQAAIALDRTLLEKDLQEVRVMNETERIRSALLSSLSHDLRTPLASVIGSASSLMEYGETFSAANRRELASTVFVEARRLDRYIQNLLDMTRLGQGKLTLERNWVDVNDIVSGAMGRIQDAGTVRFTTDIEPDLPLIWVHGALIEQALVNLLDNAVRFSPEGGRVTVSAKLRGDSLQLEVNDEGPGIADADKQKVFDMFFTAGKADREGGKGTGLGLAICQGMVAAHRGSVQVSDGRGGKGSCFRIELPIGSGEPKQE